MKTYNQLKEEISKIQLNVLEKALDKLFKSIDVDIEFTKHFFDRVNDARNGTDISIQELAQMFKSLYSQHGQKFQNFKDGMQALIKDFNTNINIPFVLKYDKKNDELDLVAKTVMRKKDFKSSNKVLKVW